MRTNFKIAITLFLPIVFQSAMYPWALRAQEPSTATPDIKQTTESETLYDSAPQAGTTSGNKADTSTEQLEIYHDLSILPFPTRRMHELILEATKAGDIEKLRDLIGVGETGTQLSLGEYEGDPIEFLKQQSGDPDGFELLAILEEVLEAGFVRMDAGTEHELYVWPYFFGVSLDELNNRQRVELFRIVTYGDYQEMKDFGGYIFYRVGISPTGRWRFFVAGD